MLKYPISTILYLTKINIKDTIKDALKLHNNIDIRLTVTVKDKNGKIIKQHKQYSHSFVSNFLALLASSLASSYIQGFGNTTFGYFFIPTNGNYAQYNPNTQVVNTVFDLNDGANDSTYGIVVGSGTATPKPTDYTLQSPIDNGTGTGQLQYGQHSIGTAPVSNGTSYYYSTSATPSSGLLPISGNTTSWLISRTFTNNSGASVQVSEVGLITKMYWSNNSTLLILITHDLLSSAITIPNGGVMAVTYTISVTT